MTKLGPVLDIEDAVIRRLLAKMLPRGQRKKMSLSLGITEAKLNSYCAHPSRGPAETIEGSRAEKIVWKLRRKPYLQARLINPLSDLTGDDRLRLHLAGPRFRKIVEQHERGAALLKEITEAACELKAVLLEMRKHNPRKAKARAKPKARKARRPFIVTGTTTRR